MIKSLRVHSLRCSILAALLVAASPILAQTGTSTGSQSASIAPREFTRELDTEVAVDLRVKAVGGLVSVKRVWNGSKWEFFPALRPLVFEGSPSAPTLITRGTAKYSPVAGSNPRRYARESYSVPQSITQNAEGWRWEHEDGTWIQYDAAGAPSGYGDLNQVGARLLRDGQGRLTGLADVENRPLITLEYDSVGHLTKARDYSGREVSYAYTNDQLSAITDVRGNVWHEDVATNRVVTDPEGRAVTHFYGPDRELLAIKDADGFGIEYKLEYNDATKQYYLQERHSGNRVIESWFDGLVGLTRKDVNGHTFTSLRKSGSGYVTTNENGAQTKVELDSLGRVVAIHLPDGASILEERSTISGLPSQITDEAGVVTKFERDSRGNVTRMTEAFGLPEQRVTAMTYDPYGQQLTRTEVVDGGAGDRVTRMTYDSYGNVASQTDAEGRTYSMLYDSAGRVTRVVDPLGKIWLFQRDAEGNVTRETDPLGHAIVREFDKVGNLVSVTDQEGAVTRFTYDRRDHLTKIVDPLGKEWLRQYDAAGFISATIDPEGHRTAYEHDLFGRMSAVVDGNGLRTSFEYFFGKTDENSADGLLVRIHYPTSTRERQFDVRDRIVRETDFDSAGPQRATSFRYDALGGLAGITFPDGLTRVYDRDAFGRQTRFVNSDGGVFQRSFSIWGDRETLTDPRSHSMVSEYDKVGMRVSETRPSGRITRFAYDARGQLASAVDPAGHRVEFEYDAAGRNTARRAFASLEAPTASQTTTFSYDGRGAMVGYVDGASSAQFVFDPREQLVSSDVDFGGFHATYAYTYYGDRKVKTFRGPDGVAYEMAYGGDDEIRVVTIPEQGTISYGAYDWMVPTQKTLPGGATQQLTYDGFLRLTHAESRDPSGALSYSRSYAYDNVDLVRQSDDAGGTTHYQYDSVRRLTSVDHLDRPDESFSYDPASNRSPGASQPAWTYGVNDELVTAGADHFTYDANGNRTQKTGPGGTQRYFYDEYDRLVRVEDGAGQVVARYAYDPFAQRIWKEVGGARTYFVYSLEGLVAELGTTGTPARSYLYTPGAGWGEQPLVQHDAAGFSFFHNDRLGSPEQLTRASGEKVWSARYDAYGAASVDLQIATNPLRFPGQYFDAETGLHYNLSRYYDPSNGAYISEDPLLVKLPRYGYADGNPISNFDSLGLFATEGHNMIFDWAFKDYGVPSDQIAAMKKESHDQDIYDFFFNIRHCMQPDFNPFLRPDAAEKATDRYIDKMLAKARCSHLLNDPSDAVEQFADAMHAKQDCASPSHHGANGLPHHYLLNPYDAIFEHNKGEGGDVVEKMHEKGELDDLIQKMRDAYDATFNAPATKEECDKCKAEAEAEERRRRAACSPKMTQCGR
jgi:RHS repeat-associated protein